MKVLVACEFSGVVRDAFLSRGHEAWSCDIVPTESVGPHIQGDVLDVLDEGWDLMIAHPPCTYLCHSGIRWIVHDKDGERRKNMMKAAAFFLALRDCAIPRIAVENPIPHRYAREYIGRPNQYIQPWEHGHGETKKTGLWLKNLPPLLATRIVADRKPLVYLEGPGPERTRSRSRTRTGIASAMAEQWG